MSTLHRGRFWVAQLLGWATFVGSGRLQRARHDLEYEGAPLDDIAVVLLAGFALGIAASTLAGVLYDRLPSRWFTVSGGGPRLAVVALGLAFALGLPAGTAWHAVEARMHWQSPEYVEQALWTYQVSFVFCLTFWIYVYHSGRVMERFQGARALLLEARAQSQAARLAALRSQLDAHFLFNALSSAIGLAAVRPRRAMELLRDLSALLRRSLEARDEATHPLREELDFLLQYLRIEQVRFGPELHLSVDVDDALGSVEVPSMILQPLVENAVKHGEWQRGALSIVLRAAARDAEVRLEVVSSGSLAVADRTDGAPGATSAPRSGRSGDGLRLVRDRLRTCYPRSGRFDLREEQEHVIARIAFDRRERVPVAA